MKAVVLILLLGTVAIFASSLEVIATINPYYLILKEIANDKINLTLLIKPGSDPHSFSPTVSDMKKLAKADLIIANGLGLDDAYLKNYKNVLYLTKYIPQDLIASDEIHREKDNENHEEFNPHIWLSLDFLSDYIIPSIADELVRKDPANAAVYRSRASVLIESLKTLSIRFDELFSKYTNSVVILDHPSYLYLFRKYGIKILSVEEGHGKQPTISHIKEILEQARNSKLLGIFVGPQFNPSAIDTISKELKVEYRILDPLGLNAKSIVDLFENAYKTIKGEIDGK
ncbi:metal ABC transporter substrate-binding protein [Thermotoga profunda]|uniref:metal ABC transporter substrate-binding protein n=1 Tax=Thermotoga profunda TaxID=1508420 RepID=UPI000596C72A|nr:metal ABC transporter substrate-binding protein [Thermotoga profunda]